MSDWIGPNTYYIVSRMKDTAFIDLSTGSAAPDAKVQIWDAPDRDNPNAIWSIVHLGIGSSGKYEYHIMNRAYWIVPVLNTKLTLNIKGGGVAGGVTSKTEIILWPIEKAGGASTKNSQWFLRLSDDAILNCPKIAPAALETATYT